jgi:hypothetical protein
LFQRESISTIKTAGSLDKTGIVKTFILAKKYFGELRMILNQFFYLL